MIFKVQGAFLPLIFDEEKCILVNFSEGVRPRRFDVLYTKKKKDYWHYKRTITLSYIRFLIGRLTGEYKKMSPEEEAVFRLSGFREQNIRYEMEG